MSSAPQPPVLVGPPRTARHQEALSWTGSRGARCSGVMACSLGEGVWTAEVAAGVCGRPLCLRTRTPGQRNPIRKAESLSQWPCQRPEEARQSMWFWGSRPEPAENPECEGAPGKERKWEETGGLSSKEVNPIQAQGFLSFPSSKARSGQTVAAHFFSWVSVEFYLHPNLMIGSP